MDLYYTSIGRGSPLNLGIAIAPSGRIRDIDVKALQKFKQQVDREFEENLISKAKLSANDTRGNIETATTYFNVEPNTAPNITLVNYTSLVNETDWINEINVYSECELL